MRISNPGALSLGQWSAIVDGWNARNGEHQVAPPTEEEFDAVVAKGRELLN